MTGRLLGGSWDDLADKVALFKAASKQNSFGIFSIYLKVGNVGKIHRCLRRKFQLEGMLSLCRAGSDNIDFILHTLHNSRVMVWSGDIRLSTNLKSTSFFNNEMCVSGSLGYGGSMQHLH